MKKNIGIIVTIITLFMLVFILGNRDYLLTNEQHIAQDGKVLISDAQLQDNANLKLVGEWSFYPNVLLAPNESFEAYKERRIPMAVPSNWNDFVEPNAEGISVGTYQLTVKVPAEGQYGLYIRTIRQANRIFINGEDVGTMGNPSAKLDDFQSENDDKYTVFAKSKNKELDIVIHVANYNYSKAGILFPIEFGTKEAIQRQYRFKVAADAFVSIGYIVFGVIYVISYSQNRKRKEELFFGLFAIFFGSYMSFINQKVFFLIVPSLDISEQIRLQLGVLPLATGCLIYFVYCTYPEFVNKKVIHISSLLLSILFFVYGIYNPFVNNEVGTMIAFANNLSFHHCSYGAI